MNKHDLYETIPLYPDTDSLESMLYNKKKNAVTPIHFFSDARNFISKLNTITGDDSKKQIFSLLTNYPKHVTLDLQSFRYLSYILVEYVKPYPFFITQYPIDKLKNLFDALCEAIHRIHWTKDTPFFVTSPYIQRFYEYIGSYEKAIEICKLLLNKHSFNNNQNGVAIQINNIGFDYALMGDHETACEYFQKAINLFSADFDKGNNLNSWLNYLLSLYHVNFDLWYEFAAKKIRHMHPDSLQDNHKRKYYITAAMHAEYHSDYDTAISYVNKAIDSGVRSETTYPEIDRKYLEKLLAKKPQAIECTELHDETEELMYFEQETIVENM